MYMRRVWLWLSPPLAAACCGARLRRRSLRSDLAEGSARLRRRRRSCYFRGDVGYSWSRDPTCTFTQTDLGGVFITDAVTSEHRQYLARRRRLWLRLGPRGIRGE